MAVTKTYRIGIELEDRSRPNGLNFKSPDILKNVLDEAIRTSGGVLARKLFRFCGGGQELGQDPEPFQIFFDLAIDFANSRQADKIAASDLAVAMASAGKTYLSTDANRTLLRMSATDAPNLDEVEFAKPTAFEEV